MTYRYKCPTCGREVTAEGERPPEYPFCSARCRQVDFYRWLSGEYSIDRDLTIDDIPPDQLPPDLRG